MDTSEKKNSCSNGYGGTAINVALDAWTAPEHTITELVHIGLFMRRLLRYASHKSPKVAATYVGGVEKVRASSSFEMPATSAALRTQMTSKAHQ